MTVSAVFELISAVTAGLAHQAPGIWQNKKGERNLICQVLIKYGT